MGSLTPFLQQEFARLAPPGWACRREVPLLEPGLVRLLGYSPRADVLLERIDGSRRLWIEFEVSRADPVANHAKFATAHFFQPQKATDCFLSMVSPHVDRGRRNLAANTVLLMRQLGMQAFQTVLLPYLQRGEVRSLNHAPLASLAGQLEVAPELERALVVSEAVYSLPRRSLYFASDPLEVLLNVRGWNAELADPAWAERWGRRTIRYFVFDPFSGDFAPSKFCAFVARRWDELSFEPGGAPMSVEAYCQVPDGTPIFDGARARQHLTERLGMVERAPEDLPRVAAGFRRWLSRQAGRVAVHPRGPSLILPPAWFR